MYELTTDWKICQVGQMAFAEKDGKKYVLKKYQTIVSPIDNGSLDKKTLRKNQQKFDNFVAYRKKINATIRPLTGEGGNIIIPCEEFIEGNKYVEVSEFIEGVVPKEELSEVLMSLPSNEKLLLMMTAAGALSAVHNTGIVHSDLKLENIILVKKDTSKYVAKLIDFDGSYFVKKITSGLSGTENFFSPELGIYMCSEDDREELGKKLSAKSDIFSLGLIFHYYLSGEFPEPIKLTERLQKRKAKGKVVYCWVALNSGGELQLSSKIKNPHFIELLNAMLRKDPGERPSASEVLRKLQNLYKEKEKPDEKPEAVEKKRFPTAPEPSVKVEHGFCEPWEEHNIVFDGERLRSRGYISGKQMTLSGVKGYLFCRGDGKEDFIKKENLLLMGFAKIRSAGAKKTEEKTVEKDFSLPPEGFEVPWPEHNIEFIIDKIEERGFVAVRRSNLKDTKGYDFYKKDGSRHFINAGNVQLLGMARKV